MGQNKSTFPGKISVFVLIIAGIIIVWGFFTFLTSHETLNQNFNPSDKKIVRELEKENSLDFISPVKNAKSKIILLKNGEDEAILVNDQKFPTISIKPGEIQRWRVKNISSSFLNFSVPGLPFYIISQDFFPTSVPVAKTEEVLSPGDAFEILVEGPGWGTYNVVSNPLPGVNDSNTVPLFQIRSEGIPAIWHSKPSVLIPFVDLSKSAASFKNELTLDGSKNYDIQNANPDSIEEWIIINPTDRWLSFEIQNGGFQVVKINNQEIERFSYDRAFAVPPKSTIVIRVPFFE